ncbi:MAG: serine/threonine-protein kinase [Myxococcota bacterium]
MLSTPDIQEGETLDGGYRIVRKIGEGGMGAVYEASQEHLGRRVAIKVLSPALAGDRDHLERFRREAMATAALGHPNIIQVTDIRWAGGRAYYVMEFLEGESLSDLLKKKRRLPHAQAVRIVSQVLSALHAAHEMGIVHRDLKPANVFITPIAAGVELVKLLDFGIAKLREGDGFRRLTATGAIVGTPQYLAPEQARGEPVDARTDVFAAGTLLYLVIGGQLPFFHPHLSEMVKNICTQPPHPLKSYTPDVPDALVAVVERALAKDPAARFASAAAMKAALEGEVADLPEPEPLPSSPPAEPMATSRPGLKQRADGSLGTASVQPSNPETKPIPASEAVQDRPQESVQDRAQESVQPAPRSVAALDRTGGASHDRPSLGDPAASTSRPPKAPVTPSPKRRVLFLVGGAIGVGILLIGGLLLLLALPDDPPPAPEPGLVVGPSPAAPFSQPTPSEALRLASEDMPTPQQVDDEADRLGALVDLKRLPGGGFIAPEPSGVRQCDDYGRRICACREPKPGQCRRAHGRARAIRNYIAREPNWNSRFSALCMTYQTNLPDGC